MDDVTRNSFANFIAIASALGLACGPLAASAQEAAPQAVDVSDPLGLPNSMTVFGEADPNLRTATAVVNGHVITGTDIDQRVALLLAANEAEISEEELIRVRMQVLRNLIDETLQIQAAEAQEIAVTEQEVAQSYTRVAGQNFGQNPEAMDAYLVSIGSSPASLKRQIEGELAWRRLLQRNIAPFVNVSEEEVNEVLQRLEQDRGTEEFRLGEIFLAATPENAAQVQSNASNIVEQLRQGGSFVAYARQYSQASTAAVGGDLGWVRLGQLPPELSGVAGQMQPGQLVGPVQIPGGYSILLLIDKRQVLTADPRDALLSLKQISINFEPGTTQEQAQARAQEFAAGISATRGCGDVESAAAALGAEVVTNNEVRARSLPEQLQSLVLALQVGQATPPFGDVADGVRVLMLCGRDDPQTAGGPDFGQMMAQLEDERVNKRAQRYLRDLRNDAYIEYN
ncbi:peptidylprolyl isomerase [Qipengyuania sp. MTN3-11]|uniref:peptidylprolyl isomerase n=1 Tax=Qipengyuania sp. MTN3-11 TaxID=3056557 RepID=UPI0036F36861